MALVVRLECNADTSELLIVRLKLRRAFKVHNYQFTRFLARSASVRLRVSGAVSHVKTKIHKNAHRITQFTLSVCLTAT